MQFVGYDTAGSADESAALVLSDGDGLERLSLDPRSELAYTLGDRHCAGTLHDGEHLACDADDAPYCRDHARTWVCARCTGTCLKDEMDCYDDHAVYLAAFAPDVFKVGVTKAWRLERRLREQGADRGAHIRTVENGRIAREYESSLTDRVTDRVRVPTKRDGLGTRVDETAWQALIDEFDPLDTYRFQYDLDLVDRPVAETTATGTVVGTKGRLLVLSRAGTTYAVDLRDLVGHEVKTGKSHRDMQTSLGAF